MAYFVNIPTDQQTIEKFVQDIIADKYCPDILKNCNYRAIRSEDFLTWLFANPFVQREAINALLKYFIIYQNKNK